jgi:hypothetical protein
VPYELLGLGVLIVAALLAARFAPRTAVLQAERALRSRRTPLLVGVATALAFLWVAGGTLAVEPLSTDEASYVLQAKLLAQGRITAPGAPIPEFFEQPWVIVSPSFYSKYPPGHALALAPGVALGLPWLIPFLLNGVAAALGFALLRRAAGPAAALLVWAAWLLSGMAMSWQASYFSEVTLLACWLGGAAAFWRWLDGHGRKWLLLAALCSGYGALTRPLSILLLVLPLAVPLVRAARGRWREVGLATALGGAVLLVQPAWNLATTGDALRSPLRVYTETYLPWDRLGFAIDSTPPLRAPSEDLRAIASHLVKVHREHTVARLPETLLERADHLRRLLFSGWRWWLIYFAVLGLWRLRGAAALAFASALAQFFGHAIWAHEAGWTLYYAESAALWFLPAGLGFAWVVERIARREAPADERSARAALAVLAALPLLLALSVGDSAGYRGFRGIRMAELGNYTTLVREGPADAIYFVRYAEERSGRPAVIRNFPPLESAKAWVVYDLGPRNQELLRAAPGRTGYLVDEGTRSVTPIARER